MYRVLADIASGETEAADIAFLVAVITAAIACIATLAKSLTVPIVEALIAFTLAALALGFLLL